MSISELLEKYKECRQPVETWTRVMGYYRNVDSFNVGKKSEFANREFYTIKHQNFSK